MAEPVSAAARGFRSLGIHRSAPAGTTSRQIHWLRTLQNKGREKLLRQHLQFKPKIARAGVLHCFLLDCSGSMLAGGQLALAQAALRHLHQRAYQQRATIALITCAGDAAIIQLQPTAARPCAGQMASPWPSLQGGGGTPLALGVNRAETLLATNRRQNPGQQQWLWLLSDGRTREMPDRPDHADVIRIIDCEHQQILLNRCRTLAVRWDADYQTLNDLLET